jgi:hypothetical protein
MFLCAVAGAGLNVYRTAYWVRPAVKEWQGFQVPPTDAGGVPTHVVRSYARMTWAAPDWRPLTLRIWLRTSGAHANDDACALDGATHTEATHVLLEVDHTPLATVTLRPEWAAYEFTIRTPASALQGLTVQLTADLDGPHGAGAEVGAVGLEPILTPSATTRYGLVGALIGMVAFFLFAPAGAPDAVRRGGVGASSLFAPASSAGAAVEVERPEGSRPVVVGASNRLWSYRQERLRVATIAAVLVADFGVWGLVKPPLQSVDEAGHLMRAAAILKAPWVARMSSFQHDVRFVNPLALSHPRQLWKVIYPSAETLAPEDVVALKQVRWKRADELSKLEPYHVALASYPPLYYWTVFAGGQAATSLGRLTPYQSVYAYRFASLCAATVLWLVVWWLLRDLTGSEHVAITVLAFAVLNPMVAYLTSAVSADASAVPFGALAILVCWRTLSRGTHAWAATVWLLLGALAKPSGLQMIAALACTTILLAATKQANRTHATVTLIALGRAAVTAWVLFYAWSPPDFPGTGIQMDLLTYVDRVVSRIPEFWVYFWGLLGWMDYKLADIWYEAIAAVLLVNAVCLWWRPGPLRTFYAFCLMTFVAFAASNLAGEFLYLKSIGYIMQGRYFLPALAGLAPLVLHRVPPARYAYFGLLALVNLLFLHATVVRCYGGDYGTLWTAMPFLSVR